MRKYILILLCFFIFWNTVTIGYALDKQKFHRTEKKVKKVKDKWLGWDKAGHLLISAFLAGSSYSIYYKSFDNDKKSSIYFASVFTLSLGAGKEISDMKKPKDRFSYKDLVFDVLGISAGILIASQ
ncbi:MAG: hypothetical protein Q8O10_03830 [candidate division Zixibacteria bacterium]|nr:hypothetical protein [candidate division Zixibacteria bacterium]